MSEPNVFHFEGFTLRPAAIEDIELAWTWTQADPAHRGTPAAFWIAQTFDVKSYLLIDDVGPVFFFRMQASFGEEGAVQVWIQFPMKCTREPDERMSRGMAAGFMWLEKVLAGIGFAAVYFDTRNPKLVYFCRRQLGFVNTGKKNEQGGMILKRRLMAEAA